jgi:hypothetical protein
MAAHRHLLIGQILVDLGNVKLEHVYEARRTQIAYTQLKLGGIPVAMNFIIHEQLEKELQVQKQSE